LNLALFSPTLHTLPLCTPHEDLPHQSLVQLSLKLQKEPQKNPPPKKKKKKKKKRNSRGTQDPRGLHWNTFS
jgi:hypothetical protein